MQEFKRKLYKRGSSYEVTIPKDILFSLNLERENKVVFKFSRGKWRLSFEEVKS